MECQGRTSGKISALEIYGQLTLGYATGHKIVDKSAKICEDGKREFFI